MSPPRAAALIVLLVGAVGLLPSNAPAPPFRAPPGPRSANYGLDDYYTMLERARGTAAIAHRRTHRPFASGVLVAEDLVLTCRHVTHTTNGSATRRLPAELEVVFEVGWPGGRARRRHYPVLAYAHTSDVLDVCVLRIGASRDGRLPEKDRVQVLSPAAVELWAPLYVVHHPRGGPLRIADDARVLFPFEAGAEEVERLAAGLPTEPGRTSLRASYRPGRDGVFRNYSLRWGGQPTLGADCLTLDGSSGAPVFHKQTHALVGLVFAGTDPTRVDVPSPWEQHEAILPAAAILADLAASEDAACRHLAERR